MKIYRIEYWFNSCITERYIKAKDKEQAKEKIKKYIGDKRIIKIEEEIEEEIEEDIEDDYISEFIREEMKDKIYSEIERNRVCQK